MLQNILQSSIESTFAIGQFSVSTAQLSNVFMLFLHCQLAQSRPENRAIIFMIKCKSGQFQIIRSTYQLF